MGDQSFGLLPINNVMQRYAAPSSQLGDIAPEAPAQPSLDDQIAGAQKQQLGYQSYGQQHPILAQMGNLVMQQHGLPAMYDANGMGYQDQVQLGGMQRQLAALKAMQAAQQEARTNQSRLGWGVDLAKHANLQAPAQGSVLNDKDITFLQQQANREGAPEYAKRLLDYKQGLEEHLASVQKHEQFLARQRAGMLGKDEKEPAVLPKPNLDLTGVNSLLTAPEVSGITGDVGASPTAGIDSVDKAAGVVNTEKSNQVQAAKLQAEINARSDANQLARDKMGQEDQHFGVTTGQKDQEIKLAGEKTHAETGSKTQTYLLTDAKSARENEHKTLNNVQTINKQILDLSKKVPLGQLQTDPRFLRLNADYRVAQGEYNKAKSVADEKQARADRYASSQQEAPVNQPAAAPALPVRQSASEAPTKIRMSRAEAKRLGLIK